MLAHRIDLADDRAGAQQRAGHRLLVVKRYTGGRRDPVSGCAARHQHQHEIICAGAVGEAQRALRAFDACGVGNRMAGLDHLDATKMPSVAVARDRNATQPLEGNPQPVEIMRFGDLRHRTGSLARRKQDQPVGRRLRQQWRQACGRMCRGDRSAEEVGQKCAERRGHILRHHGAALLFIAAPVA